MILNIGTKNKCKINALTETIKDYEFIKNSTINSYQTDSGVPEQPMSLEETIYGAKNRSLNCFNNCKYSFGIESGIFNIDNNNYMDICACSIYDGNEFHMGLSQSFVIPRKTMNFVLKGQDLTLASVNSKLTHKLNLGEEEGIIGILTKGRINRQEYTKSAIQMALINLEN